MNRVFLKTIAIILTITMMFTVLGACGSKTEAPAQQEAETTPSEAPVESSQAEKEVVSVEVYEDCDGSGHGVKIITYSDGTQEEVAF